VHGFVALSTKLVNKQKPIVQQQRFSEGKSEAMNYTRCCTLAFILKI